MKRHVLQRISFGLIFLFGQAGTAAGDDDEFANGSVIFARGDHLIQLQLKTKEEVELAAIGPRKVHTLATDVAARVLLVGIEGTWYWLPLDGSKSSLVELPCGEGAATLTPDGDAVACRAKTAAPLTMIVQLGANTSLKADVVNGQIVGKGTDRKLVWADRNGVWGAPPGNRKAAKKLALEAPKRGFLASPDGTRAMGTYDDEVYVDVHHKKPAEVLMGFALDGEGARRKAIRSGNPIAWSHDSRWVLVQDSGSACLMHATGGEYKCWSGYTAVSIFPDGTNVMLLGKRDRRDPRPAKKSRSRKAAGAPSLEGGGDSSRGAAALPTGQLSLYRGKLEGSAFTESPSLIAKVVDSGGVWIPPRPAAERR
jgi:hypothetical protein